jgi:hypothetical protein
VITLGYSGNTYGTFLQDMWSPPDKRRGIKQALGSGIFSNLNMVAFLDICQALPACSPIFPLNTKVHQLNIILKDVRSESINQWQKWMYQHA